MSSPFQVCSAFRLHGRCSTDESRFRDIFIHDPRSLYARVEHADGSFLNKLALARAICLRKQSECERWRKEERGCVRMMSH